MNRKQMLWLLTAFVVISILTACTSQETSQPDKEPTSPATEEMAAEMEEEQEEAAATEEIPTQIAEEGEEEVVAEEPAGEELYQANCARCHGADRSGQNGPALLPDRLLAEPSYYINVITNGSGPMPAFGSRLSEDEISALVDFIRSEP